MDPTRVEQLARRGRGTGAGETGAPVAWADLEGLLRRGGATTWLSTRAPSGVHTRPVFAAWGGSSFFFATKSSAAKTRHLDADGAVSLAIDLSSTHLVVEGTALRLRAEADLERAAQAMRDVYDWPAEPRGDELDAPYGAPTSGGPPFRAYEVAPARAFAFPTADQHEPTRFVW